MPSPPTAVAAPRIQCLGIGNQFLRFFGAEAGEFSKEDLTEYLDRIARNKQCDCGLFDFLSDDKARAIANQGGVGDYKLDQAYKDLPSSSVKRILIQEMLAGPTGDSDERAIIKILNDSSPQQIKEVLDPSHDLSLQDLDDNIQGENHDALVSTLEAKVPDLGRVAANFSAGCSQEMRDKLIADAVTAQAWVNNAVARLGEASTPGDPAGLAAQLKRHFKIDQDALSKKDPAATRALTTVMDVFTRIRDAFGGKLPFECDAGGNESDTFIVVAETKSLDPWRLIGFPYNIVFYRAYFGLPDDERAATIVHEMAHKYANRGEQAYLKHNFSRYIRLSTDEALDNADSFAQFARYILQR